MLDLQSSIVKWPTAPERPGIAILRQAIMETHPGRIAVLSSFGAEASLLLAIVAEIDPAVPVLFLDTLKHFPETLSYRDRLTAHLGLRDVRTIAPDPREIGSRDPDGDLHQYIPDDCCELRKVSPLARALEPFDAWINGRKRYQGDDRAALRFTEIVDGRVKLNPLADWTASEITAEIGARGLPGHPLVPFGFRSIGCAPCTRAIRPGEATRAGRWSAQAKTECGIHARPSASRLGKPDIEPDDIAIRGLSVAMARDQVPL